MYLKSLTIHGFKSFAQRVELVFPRGVTAIVGPNGSGKSNVSDAIRWVLGEQNIRSLRGSALQDVIFAGTDSRKPLGMAEVSITFDNSDFALPLEYAEVTITRRTYRSGESEFLINRTPCRLRDIHDLLMDSGLGRGSLSVIGQGEVDAILSVRPEERRALIEEVAGITRYRSKRQAALERLNETEANLVRLGDIVAEVERQLHPLEREAERARRYRELSARLSELETKLLLHEWAVRTETRSQWEARRDEARASWLAAKDGLEKVQSLRREALGEAAALQDALSGAQGDLARLERMAEQQDAHGQVLDERLGAFRSELDRRASELEELARERRMASDRRDELARRSAKLSEQAARAEASLAETEQRVKALRERIDQTDAALKELRAQAMARVQRAADAQAELRSMAASIAERGEELQRRREELRLVEAQLQETARERERTVQAIADLESVQADLQALAARIGHSLSELEAVKRSRAERVQTLRGRLTGLRTQYDALRELDESFEGFGEGVRACLRAKRPWREKVYGAVGSLLQVAPEYELALEVALGAAAQNIVVADEDTAKQAIAYLKEARAGRVTFLPLSSLRVSPPLTLPQHLENDPECLGLASRLVRFDPTVAKAVEYLLGRVLVTRTLDGAVRLNRSHPHIQRLVSLEGDLVLASGPITGGHYRARRGAGLLSRRHRLAALKDECERLAADVAAEEERLAEIEAEIDSAVAERSAVEGRLQAVLRDVAEKQRVRDVLGERVQALESQKERIEAAVVGLQEAIARLTAEHAEMSRRFGSLDTDKELQNTEVEELERQLAVLRDESDSLEEVRAQQRAAWAEAQSALKAVLNEIEQTEAHLSELKARRQSREEECRQLTERIAQTEAERVRVQDEAAALRRQAAGVRAEVERLKSELERFQTEIDAWSEREEAARAEVEAAAQRLHEIELGLERERAACAQAEERLAEREIPLPHSPDGVRLPAVEPVRSEARSVRRELEALGAVNLNAIEEFAALKERYAFLSEQRDDLIEAKEGLERAIEEMDRVSRDRLVAAFESLQKALSAVFPRLFGGGRAVLSWTDPENPLESGIDMLVQPPGKRPQPLLTLSGGERALAAASLLFAIMTVRPSPFFVLDEVDAALDEANVDRFAQLLQEYGKRNQIIVITHRQGTMERADALFGVTMERHGASQLVSLRLDDALPAAP